MKLGTRLVEKPWGRIDLQPLFDEHGDRRIGEIWFEAPEALPLLVKYIFTSERLSIQVHPDDEQGRALGLTSGKSECWTIIDAEAGATLGIGLKHEVTAEELRSAALDGSIEEILDWRPVRAGDFFYVPPGTVHAIGAGISLLEFQQNQDVTFRLYDYGRPRELHLDEAVAVAACGPYPDSLARSVDREISAVLVDGPHFSLVHVVDGRMPADALETRRRWVVPLEGMVRSGGDSAGPGDCLLIAPGGELNCAGARALIGVEGGL